MVKIDQTIDTEFEKVYKGGLNIDNKSRVHDWRNHVPQAIIDIWDELTEREQKLIAITAERGADNEYWD
jgi:hypothetical protein